MKRKIIAGMVLFVMCISMCMTSFAASFSDMPATHWAYMYVSELSNQGIINGYEDGSFRPAGEITRAEFIKLMVSTDESLIQAVEQINASNVNGQEKWYSSYVNVAKLLIGIPEYTDEQLTLPINRLEVAYITARFMVFEENRVLNALNKNDGNNDAYYDAIRKANEKLKYIKGDNLTNEEIDTKLFELSEKQRNTLLEEVAKIQGQNNTTNSQAKNIELTKEEQEMVIAAWNKVLLEYGYIKKDGQSAKQLEKVCEKLSEDKYREVYFMATQEYQKLRYQVFKDLENLNSNDLVCIAKVKEAGIINGYEDETYRPYNTLTRAESATILYRYIKYCNDIRGGI